MNKKLMNLLLLALFAHFGSAEVLGNLNSKRQMYIDITSQSDGISCIADSSKKFGSDDIVDTNGYCGDTSETGDYGDGSVTYCSDDGYLDSHSKYVLGPTNSSSGGSQAGDYYLADESIVYNSLGYSDSNVGAYPFDADSADIIGAFGINVSNLSYSKIYAYIRKSSGSELNLTISSSNYYLFVPPYYFDYNYLYFVVEFTSSTNQGYANFTVTGLSNCDGGGSGSGSGSGSLNGSSAGTIVVNEDMDEGTIVQIVLGSLVLLAAVAIIVINLIGNGDG